MSRSVPKKERTIRFCKRQTSVPAVCPWRCSSALLARITVAFVVEDGVYDLGHTTSCARNRQDHWSLSQIVEREVMQEAPSKRPPNLTVHNLSTSAHEDSLFSPGVNTPGHRVPLSKQDSPEVTHYAQAICRSVVMDYCSKFAAIFAVKDFQDSGADAFNLICISKGSTKK